MPSSLRWPDALAAGVASSMRSAAGPAVLALRGRFSGPARIGLIAAGVGELATDKTAAAKDRIIPPSVALRAAAGAFTGREIAGPAGLAAGGVGAAAGTYATWRLRRLAGRVFGVSDPVVGAVEDVVAVSILAIATRPGSPEVDAEGDAEIEIEVVGEAPETSGIVALIRDAGTGLIAGAAGTLAMTLAQGTEFVLTDAEASDAPATVADKLSVKLGRGHIRHRSKPIANQGMHWLYGISWGIPYGVIAARAKTPPEISGPIFGLIVWTVALGQQPALGVADLPWKRSPQSLGSEAFFHVVYGVGAGAGLRALRNR